jgi:hypothetical protein
MTRRVDRLGAERGAAALEVAGVAPLVILGALVALQFGVAGWTIVSTHEAARDGARAYSLGGDPRAAAEGALPGIMTVGDGGGALSGDGYTYTVTVKVPTVITLDLGSVTRSVTMPVIR